MTQVLLFPAGEGEKVWLSGQIAGQKDGGLVANELSFTLGW